MRIKTETLAVRVEKAEIDLLDSVVAKTPYANRSDIAREALRRGLATMTRKKRAA